MDSYTTEYGRDSDTEPKRKMACDYCRRKKLKCEWDDDSMCNRCVQRRVSCIPHQAQRKSREKKANTYLSSLEGRLQRMEAAILKSASSMTLSRPPSEGIEHQSIPDQISALKINQDGTTTFLGSASGYSIISPSGLKWIAEVTGSNEFAQLVAQIPNLGDSKATSNPNAWCQLPEEQRAPMPSKRRAGALLDSFFREGFNQVFPLFDETEVRDRFSHNYPVDHTKDVAWYAALNIIFATSEIVAGKNESPRASVDSPASSNHSKSQIVDIQEASWWKWFRNGSSKFLELQFMDGSLLAVQTMALMCFVLQTLPNPYSSLVVATSALRSAQAIGLHRNLPYLNLTTAEYEQRRNIFWIAFIIERQILIRMGRPSIIHEDDIGIDLPHETGRGSGLWHLRRMSQLGLIQGKIYNSLYSSKSLAKSRLERLRVAGYLDEEIQHWRDQIPLATRPGSEITPPAEGSMLPIIMMHLAYFNALTMIHRISSQTSPWKDKNDEQFNKELLEMDINPRVFSGGAICVSAARSMIKLLEKSSSAFNVFDFNMIRVLAYYPLSASLTLFANVLQQPRHPQALRDVEMMKSVTTFLSGYFDDKEELENAFIIKTFTDINKLAEEFVQKSCGESPQGVKRGSDGSSAVSAKLPMGFRGHSPLGSSVSVSRQPSTETSQSPVPPTKNPWNPLPLTYQFDLPSTSGPHNSDLPYPTVFQLQDFPMNQTSFSNSMNDPLIIPDQTEGLNSSSTVNFDPNWLAVDDRMMQPELFIPHDGSWFFPVSNHMVDGDGWNLPRSGDGSTGSQTGSTIWTGNL